MAALFFNLSWCPIFGVYYGEPQKKKQARLPLEYNLEIERRLEFLSDNSDFLYLMSLK